MKAGEASLRERDGFRIDMSRRFAILAAGFGAVLCAVAAFGWLHVRNGTPAVTFTPEPDAGKPGRTANVSPTENAGGPASPKKVPPELSFAPIPGEVLDFSATVAKVDNVASLQLKISGETQVGLNRAWHLQAFAHTRNPLRMVFTLDDQFDSYSTPEKFTSLQYEMHLNERGERVNSVQRLSATGKEAAPAGTSMVRVMPGTRDPLGLMQYLRSVDWATTHEVNSPVFDGRKLYAVHARRTGSAKVTVPAGTYATNAIDIRVYDNGAEMKDAHFALYIGNDEKRTPALLEATLPFATARVELTKRSN